MTGRGVGVAVCGL